MNMKKTASICILTLIMMLCIIPIPIPIISGERGWVKQSSGTLNDLYDVYFFDKNYGWAVGEHNTSLRTTDGGAIWITQHTDNTDIVLMAIDFCDKNNGWIASTYGWQSKIQDPNYQGPTHKLIDSSGNLIYNWSALWYTNNSGATWKIKFAPTNFWLTGLSAQTPGHIVVTSFACPGHADGDIWTSKDYGKTFKRYSYKGWSFYMDVDFVNSDIGWGVGGKTQTKKMALVHNTTDGGVVWGNQTIPGEPCVIYGVSFVNTHVGWVVGSSGRILHTTNGGSTWVDQSSGVTSKLEDVYFVNLNIGWAVGDGGTILCTTDGGATWIKQSSSTLENLRSVKFVDTMHGWIVGNNGTILYTSDGGGIIPEYPNIIISMVAIICICWYLKRNNKKSFT